MKAFMLLLLASSLLLLSPANAATFTIPWGLSTNSSLFSITINVGDTVIWQWADSASHDVVSGENQMSDGIFTSGDPITMQGFTFTRTFNMPGLFPYFDSVHPDVMFGTITVIGSTTAASTIATTTQAITTTAPTTTAPRNTTSTVVTTTPALTTVFTTTVVTTTVVTTTAAPTTALNTTSTIATTTPAPTTTLPPTTTVATTTAPTTTTANFTTNIATTLPTTNAFNSTVTLNSTSAFNSTIGTTTAAGTISSNSSMCDQTRKSDIAFLLDSTSNINNATWNLMLAYVAALVDLLPISDSASRVAFAIYSTNATIVFGFDSSFDKTTLKNSILSAPLLGGDAYTGRALAIVGNTLLTSAYGFRGGEAVVILMTASNSLELPVSLNADVTFIQSVAEVFVIGVGSTVSPPELKMIASKPTETHTLFLTVVQLAEFENSTNFIQDVTCVPAETTTMSTMSSTARITQATTALPANCERNCPIRVRFTIIGDYNVLINSQNDITAFILAILSVFFEFASRISRIFIFPSSIGVSFLISEPNSTNTNNSTNTTNPPNPNSPRAMVLATQVVNMVNNGNFTMEFKNKTLAALPGSAVSEPVQNSHQNDDGGLSGGAIAGIVIGCVVGAILIIAILVALLAYGRRSHGSRDRQVAMREPMPARPIVRDNYASHV